MSDEELRNAWQQHEGDPFRMSPDEIRRSIAKVERRERVNRYGGYVVCGIVTASCIGWWEFLHTPLARAGSLLLALAMAYFVLQFVMRTREIDRTLPLVELLRLELARMRDYHSGVQFWSRLLAFLPGAALLFAGFAAEHPEVARTIAFEAIASVLLLVAAIPLNYSLARKYAKSIQALDRLRG